MPTNITALYNIVKFKYYIILLIQIDFLVLQAPWQTAIVFGNIPLVNLYILLNQLSVILLSYLSIKASALFQLATCLCGLVLVRRRRRRRRTGCRRERERQIRIYKSQMRIQIRIMTTTIITTIIMPIMIILIQSQLI